MPSDKLIKVTKNLRDEIARRQAVCEAATPGTWISFQDDGPYGGQIHALYTDDENPDNDRMTHILSDPDGDDREEDRAFIAHARTGYPETLAALADAVAALEWYANRGSVEPRTISGRRAKDALAQIAGRLESKG